MARTWLSVRVELLGGRGEEIWPWPGRIFAVGPAHTFADLAQAINTAFARWDHAHLSMFTLADGRQITDAETAAELTNSFSGPIPSTLDIETAKVATTVQLGEELQLTFDLGDDWTHRCLVGEALIDPLETLGIRPASPLPYWGWGSMPDQYGRRWDGDDGQSPAPGRPSQPHPMLTHGWPTEHQTEAVDIRTVRSAVARKDGPGLRAAITGTAIDDSLQQIGAGLPMALEQLGDDATPVVLAVLTRLQDRGWPGDAELAEDLLARLRGEPAAGRLVPVDLDTLADMTDGVGEFSTGCYLDLETGEAYDDSATDAGMVGEDAAIDVEAEPDRWLFLPRSESRDGWRDMAAFAAAQHDAGLRTRLERAIEGKGAFRRFRDLVHEEGIAEHWYRFSADRRQGRVRELLAAEGIRVG